jgi:hypothetical protein
MESTPRNYYLRGPDSGGVYFVAVRGDELTHEGSGENAPDPTGDRSRELVSAFLLTNEGRDDLAPVLREMRADLEGDHRLGIWTLHFVLGHPTEARTVIACGDVGPSGHRCGASCARAFEPGDLADLVGRMVGRAVKTGSQEVHEDPRNRYVSLGVVGLDDSVTNPPARLTGASVASR